MKNDIELLKTVKAAYEMIDIDFELEDVDGKPGLFRVMGGNELAPLDCGISVARFESSGVGFQLSVTVFYELDEDIASCVQRLLPSMNRFLSVGCFCLMPVENCLYLNSAFLIDRLSERDWMSSLSVNMDVLTATASRARELLLPLVNGETAPDSVREEDFYIKQLG